LNGFSSPAIYYKRTLVFMNNFYHKLAVTSVFTALSFTLGTNKEAKAATFYLPYTAEFFIENKASVFDEPDLGFTNQVISFPVVSSSRGEQMGFYEFSLSNMSLVNKATFTIQSDDSNPSHYHPYLAIYGYIGNGKADLSDFYAGPSLGEALDIQLSHYPDRISFDVTRFVNERVSNRDAFLGINITAIRRGSGTNGYSGIANINRSYYPPELRVETDDAPEPVPEPTTIFGSALILGVGGWLKRKKSRQQHKTTPQH
jgi:hypothetical protein